MSSRGRKRYLGPDSIGTIPASTRARLNIQDRNEASTSQSCESVRSEELSGQSYSDSPPVHAVLNYDEDERDHQCSSNSLRAASVKDSEFVNPITAETKSCISCDEDMMLDHPSSDPPNSSFTDTVSNPEWLVPPAEPVCNDETYHECDRSSVTSSIKSSSSEHSLSLMDDFSDAEDRDQQDYSDEGQAEDHEVDDFLTPDARLANPEDSSEVGGAVANVLAEHGHQPEAAVPIEDLPGQQSHPKLRKAMLGEFSNRIETPVTASRNDLLYMALGLAGRNKDSNTSFCNMIGLLNSTFASPILPETKYLIDNLLLSDIGVDYYFYCSSCYNFFQKLDYRTLKIKICGNCQTRNHVSDLRQASFFVMYDIPLQLEILFSSDPELFHCLLPPTEACKISPDGVFSDITSGSMYKKFAEETSHIKERILSFHFFIDGTPAAISSNCSIWPIQLALNELPAHERMQNLLLGGLWFGKSQPPMDLFLTPFISHIRRLAEGFQLKVNNQLHPARCYCIGCSADSGARGLVQGVVSHGGYFSCNWCKIKGQWISGAVRYPLSDNIPEIRFHKEVVELQTGLFNLPDIDSENDSEREEEEDTPRQPELCGVKAVSALINLPQFDMVNGFLFESMHCVDLGIVRAFFTLWLEESGQEYYIKLSVPEMNRRIKALRVPLEFRRMPRTFKERLKMKSREWNNLIITSYAILKGILPDRFLNSWLLFVQANCLLHQASVTIEQVHLASDLINLFLTETQMYYGQKHMSFNLHIFKHVTDHTLRWGSPWATSAYAFEGGNGKIKRMVHSVQGIPQQITRSYSWDLARRILEPMVSERAKNFVSDLSKSKSHHQNSTLTQTGRLIGKPKDFQLCAEEEYLFEQNNHNVVNVQSFEKLVYNRCAFVIDSKKCARTSNSVSKLVDNSVVLIKIIFYDTCREKVFIIGSTVHWDPIFTAPSGMRLERNDHYLRSVTFIDEELRYVPVSLLDIICFRTKFTHVDLLVPLPNHHNRF